MATSTVRRRIVGANGLFLVLAGGFGFTADVLGYGWGMGPWGHHLTGSTLAIGFLEAHGLAILMGLGLLLVAPADGRVFWHRLALGTHLLLGSANLVFFDGFIAWGQLAIGILTTAAHWIFVLAHLYALWVARQQPGTLTEARQA